MSKKQSFVAITFGALLVLSAAFAPVGGNVSPVQSANAQDWVETCYVGPVMVVDSPALTGGQLCPDGESDIEELNATETQETKTNIYDSISTQAQSDQTFLTSMNNYLNDTDTIALMEGKNAYIRALENGSSEASARNDARQAIANYYSTKQKNLIASWNTTVSVANSTHQTAVQTSGISHDYVEMGGETWDSEYTSGNFNMSFTTSEVELVNASTVTSKAFYNSGSVAITVAVNDGNTTNSVNDGTTGQGSRGVRGWWVNVQPPNDNFQSRKLVEFHEYSDAWNKTVKQNTEVQDEVDTFINNTYDEYQQGEINSSDLIDPYLGSRNYDPQNGSSWALRSLTAMGLSPPENISITREMVVSQSGVNYTGILMSDGLPEGNAFTVGETYNASNLTGHQFVALSEGGTHSLKGEFTLESVETTSGDQMDEGETVGYETVNYETSSTEEYQELQSQLDLLTQQLNERQEVIYAGGGSGGSGGPSIPPWLQEQYFGVPLYGIILTGIAGAYVINTFRRGS